MCSSVCRDFSSENTIERTDGLNVSIKELFEHLYLFALNNPVPNSDISEGSELQGFGTDIRSNGWVSKTKFVVSLMILYIFRDPLPLSVANSRLACQRL